MEKDIINILIVDDEKYEGILIENVLTGNLKGFTLSAMYNVQKML